MTRSQRGRRMFCPCLKRTGGEAQGGHAEYMLMNADATYLIPDKASYEQDYSGSSPSARTANQCCPRKV